MGDGHHGNTANRDIRRAERAERQQVALTLRRQRQTYPQIAEAMGCSLSTAHKLVRDAISAIPAEAAEEVRQQELESLDAIERPQLAAAEAGDIDAAEVVLKIKARRARYLGLDAPAQQETHVKIEDMSLEEIQARCDAADARRQERHALALKGALAALPAANDNAEEQEDDDEQGETGER